MFIALMNHRLACSGGVPCFDAPHSRSAGAHHLFIPRYKHLAALRPANRGKVMALPMKCVRRAKIEGLSSEDHYYNSRKPLKNRQPLENITINRFKEWSPFLVLDEAIQS